MSSVLVLGGYGVFGFQVAQGLVGRHAVTIAGRDPKKLHRAAQALGPEVRGRCLDVTDFQGCCEAFRAYDIVIHCAGPFSKDHTEVIRACLDAGCHYLDICDDRAYFAGLGQFAEAFKGRNKTAVGGCSSLPGISAILVKSLLAQKSEAPSAAAIELAIGNKNSKGQGAVESVFRLMGRKITTSQGEQEAIRDSKRIAFPAPFGSKLACLFESPEYDLFPQKFHIPKVEVRIAFEWSLLPRVFSFISRRSQWLRDRLKRPLLALGNWMSGWGTSAGLVQVSLRFADGTALKSQLLAKKDGQKMALRPVFVMVDKISEGKTQPGVYTADDWITESELAL